MLVTENDSGFPTCL